MPRLWPDRVVSDRLVKFQNSGFAVLMRQAFRRILTAQELELIHINLVSPQRHRKPVMRRHPLVPEITLALAVKLAVILAAALFVFSPGQRPRIDSTRMEERLIGTAPEDSQPRSILP